MHLRLSVTIVVTYIVCCLRIGVPPWRYWQLNARYFCAEKGIFSKLFIDTLIPNQWRLPQAADTGSLVPSRFPVFLKPEWGQNASGIIRADNQKDLQTARLSTNLCEQQYLVQEAALETREFELFSIDIDRNDNHHDVLTVTETINRSSRFPVNSINNKDTQYNDISHYFNDEQKARLAGYLSQVGQFGISRMCVRANSTDDLVNGKFHVIEVNLFIPMPINLMDRQDNWLNKWRFIRRSMMCLAKATRQTPVAKNASPIFSSMVFYGRSFKLSPAHEEARRTACRTARRTAGNTHRQTARLADHSIPCRTAHRDASHLNEQHTQHL